MTRTKIVGALAALVAALGASAAASGCNAVLGIDRASLDPEGGSADPSSCQAYCDAIMQNCTGANAEYINLDVCMAMCSKFDLGSPGDQTGDSRACRIYHANAAAGAPTVHCHHAGPLGFPACQTHPCLPFCLLDTALCGSLATPPYKDELACDDACGDPDAGFAYQPSGDIAQQSGNTLNCRLYHLESAYDPSTQGAQMTHCPHTGVQSAPCK